MGVDREIPEPARKRLKTDNAPSQIDPSTTSSTSKTTDASSSVADGRGQSNKRPDKAKLQKQPARKQTRSTGSQLFSQPSVINVGDKGIFVTADKGHEKKSLLEINDLVQQFLEDEGIDVMGNATEDTDKRNHGEAADVGEANIEADIASELASMQGRTEQNTSAAPAGSIRLITLDVPCVSFVRLPPASKIDPTHLVHKICVDAWLNPTRQKSRHIRRLTPISTLGKALGKGLESICDQTLPTYFGPNVDGEVRSTKFAIRPTTRNNDKIDRDTVIKHVATRIGELGADKHTVDLKNCDKAVLVEVYRGWVGIAVVDNTREKYAAGFEELKRFNLAEVYAAAHNRVSASPS